MKATAMTSQDAKAPESNKAAMPDVQGSADSRQVPINKVGVKDIRYPIALMRPDSDAKQHLSLIHI